MRSRQGAGRLAAEASSAVCALCSPNESKTRRPRQGHPVQADEADTVDPTNGIQGDCGWGDGEDDD